MNNLQKQNNKYWFKRRRYGYGWTPVTGQGWAIVLVLLVVAAGGSFFVKDSSEDKLTTSTLIYIIAVLVAALAVIVASFVKGPKPKWRWGAKPTDNPEEDI